MRIVKEALHLSTVPSSVACRDVEQKVLEFCKSYIEQEKAHGYSFGLGRNSFLLVMVKVVFGFLLLVGIAFSVAESSFVAGDSNFYFL
ncbi:hypothetical protein RchiOBHm_Chr2g0117421 [Rosa chinensis]|uniref:Uncharacterized protein n=1 Tax=Rosa chinensis TaxID=74649 RepID=A0A2P6RRH3_ROSCH|nr:hypothetical protein RchiOBHm_Chr2g0117421 [Rosa chinensis]